MITRDRCASMQESLFFFYFDLFEAFDLIKIIRHKSFFSPKKKPINPHACATCVELPSSIGIMAVPMISYVPPTVTLRDSVAIAIRSSRAKDFLC